MSRQIDSYYLLMVKLLIAGEPTTPIVPSVYLVDMLDWLEYVTFDSGPGQIMLKAKRFIDEYDPNKPRQLDIKAKLRRLMELYEDGERRLKENRERALDQYRQDFQAFMAAGDLSVTPETQRTLFLE